MAKNKLTLSVTANNARLLPSPDDVAEWVKENYERCRETARRSEGGATVSFKIDYPFEDDPDA